MIGAFLSAQPLLTLFLVIATGYAIGAISVRRFSLGVGAVLFTGLFVGAVAPAAQPPALVGTLGLVMFLYGLGVQFGAEFVAGLTGQSGRRYNLLAGFALAAAAAIAVMELAVMDVSHPLMAGLFAGAGTNSATMQAAMEAAGNTDPVVGYSVAYPFGIVGAILCMYVFQLVLKPDVDTTRRGGLQTLEVAVRSAAAVGRSIGEVAARLPAGVRILVVRAEGENRHPMADYRLGPDSVVLLGSDDTAALDAARRWLGEAAAGRVVADRAHLDVLRVFVSRPSLAGTRVEQLPFPDDIAATVTHVNRGDAELLVTPDLTLELGDRVGLLTDRRGFAALRRFFGDSMRGTTEFSYVALGIGMVLGVLLGTIAFPVPLVGTFKLGVAGGTLIVALLLGKLRRTGALIWTMPLSANLTLRNFGLSVFLAQVGLSSGSSFVQAVAASGPILLLAGAAILVVLALTPLLIGHYVMRVPFDDLLGITAGVTGQPAILAYAFRSVPSDRVEVCYAMIHPTTTVLKIIIAQLLIAAG
jgi:putative transport protein